MKKIIISAIFCVAFLGLWACSSDSGTDPVQPAAITLTVDISKIDFVAKGNVASVTVTTDAKTWDIASNATWVQLSKSSGTKGTSLVSITALENTTTVARTAIVTISSGEAASVQISVSQVAGTGAVLGLYPSYNINPIADDATGMGSTAIELAAKMKLGWNIGNTLEATPGSETAWGNPKVTKALIDLVRQMDSMPLEFLVPGISMRMLQRHKLM